MGDTLVRYLEADFVSAEEVDARRSPARDGPGVAGIDPQLTAQLNLMLAECFGRVGRTSKAARCASAGRRRRSRSGIRSNRDFFGLAQSGQFDQALRTLLPLAASRPERRLILRAVLLQRAIRQPKDRRNWQEVEQSLKEAEKALPQAVEPVVLMRLDMLAAQDRLDDARSVLSLVLAKAPRNLRYRLALARLIQLQGKGAAALQVMNDAEKELGPNPEIFWRAWTIGAWRAAPRPRPPWPSWRRLDQVAAAIDQHCSIGSLSWSSGSVSPTRRGNIARAGGPRT